MVYVILDVLIGGHTNEDIRTFIKSGSASARASTRCFFTTKRDFPPFLPTLHRFDSYSAMTAKANTETFEWSKQVLRKAEIGPKRRTVFASCYLAPPDLLRCVVIC